MVGEFPQLHFPHLNQYSPITYFVVAKVNDTNWAWHQLGRRYNRKCDCQMNSTDYPELIVHVDNAIHQLDLDQSLEFSVNY